MRVLCYLKWQTLGQMKCLNMWKSKMDDYIFIEDLYFTSDTYERERQLRPE